jgi:aldose sugar dehydrogenase
LAFDPVTQKLWMTENGPDTYDEINLMDPGFNSGWVQIMGPDARSPQGSDSLLQLPGSHYADPKFSWFDTVAPTALVFLNSTRLGAQYANDVFVGDVNTGTLYHFRLFRISRENRTSFRGRPNISNGLARRESEF